MPRKPDWDALGKLFAPSLDSQPGASEGDTVRYLGEPMPKWLALDLMRERAAIYEYEAGMSRDEAEAKARKALEK
ncbi:hypothetical protein SAMN04488030_2604 [Aliiroseovarius halocynthiae]|uniref:Uncharacterized protein n=1 Tax=Aliiroseovarius halocynthiae TaxID=985055 RepID=A0A545SPZ2_9RHOB|nr:hypothetical protein [Aliiroseovarius halocynthiae]TQV67024.1 hypothetical protein FIL88_10565 [Aliiroseovarius halocynthiae]SMR82257.1 hypothetical protein SAMN04488030_2604 [Aliiroseovarius halocynthiae]